MGRHYQVVHKVRHNWCSRIRGRRGDALSAAGDHGFGAIFFELGITWYLNRIWTFERTDQARLPQSARYVMVQLLGAAFNFAIFALCISIGPPVFGRFPIIALAIASAAAMILNFVGSRHWAFSGER